MNCVGRLAQRLERSVYTRKVVRSNRTVPTIRAQNRITLSGDVAQLVKTLPRHWLESRTVTPQSPEIPRLDFLLTLAMLCHGLRCESSVRGFLKLRCARRKDQACSRGAHGLELCAVRLE